MIHTSGQQRQNVTYNSEVEMEKDGYDEMYWSEFYPIDDLEKDGFIHKDGSLRF